MSAPGVSRIPPLRCAGALVLCAVAGAGVQTLIQPSTSPSPAEARSAAGFTPSSGNTAARAAMPTRESLAALSPEEQITTLAAALPQMEIADLLPLVEHLLKARGVAAAAAPSDPFAPQPPDLISPLLRALFTRWAALDAAGLMAFTESGPLRYDYDTRRLAVLALVEVRGLPALEEVRGKSPSLAREAAHEMLLSQPDQLEALLPFLKGGYHNPLEFPFMGSDAAQRISQQSQIAEALGPERFLFYAMETDIPADDALQLFPLISDEDLLKAIKALPPGQRRDQVLATWLKLRVGSGDSLIDNKDHYTFFRREYEAMAEGPARSALNGRYATLRALENPEAALAWARALGDRKQRSEALSSICSQLPEDAPPSQVTKLLAEAWMANPEDYTVGFPSGNPSIHDPFTSADENAVRIQFRAWHQASAQEAEAWLRTVTEPTLRAELTQALLAAQPGASLALLTDSSLRMAYAADVLLKLETTVFSDIRGRLHKPPEQPPASIVPPEMVPLARLHHLENHPPNLAEWSALTPEERRALSAAAIKQRAGALRGNEFGSLSQPESNDWLTLFNSLPPGERSLGAYYETGAAYIKSDEAAASQWMESLPPGAERDAAATALVEHLVKPGDSQDGEAAFAWAAAMSGEPERTRYTAEAARAWAAEDPAAARTAVEASALPAAQKSALLQQLPAQGGAR